MTEISQYWTGRIADGALGDAGPYSAAQYATEMARVLNGAEQANRGVIRGVESELEVTPNSPTAKNVLVESGAAVVQGRFYYNDSTETLTIADNVSGSTRIDYIVLSADYAAQEIRLAVVQGTPGAGHPAITQNAGILWQIPLAYLTLASGYTSITAALITDLREYANIPGVIGFDVQNVSIGNVEGGSVMIWSGSSGVETTVTAGNNNIAGVMESRVLADGFGRVILAGVYPVLCAASVTFGDQLVSSATAGQANTIKTVAGRQPFARVLTGNSGAGTKALCLINVLPNQSAQKVKIGTYTGDGAASKAITGVGFTPDEVTVYKITNSNPCGVWLRTSNSVNSLLLKGIDGGGSPFTALFDNDAIISLDSDGFSIGDNTGLGGNVINLNGASYGYIARG